MRPPEFWQANTTSLLPRLLAPLGRITAGITAARLARAGWTAPVPVICCGNVTSGGAGKTTLALDLGERLRARGIAVHFLSRGYGRRSHSVVRVGPGATADQVGDEPRLLAAIAPTWVGADRAATARAAIAAGAGALIMDDGLQNPSLHQSCSLLVIDGRSGIGNARLLPAGPLREPLAAAAARCQAAIVIGEDQHHVATALPHHLPILQAHLRPGPRTRALSGRRVLAFAGIADPTKFFATLIQAGAVAESCVTFADHHPYRDSEIVAVLQNAQRNGLTPVTTAKDAVRLPAPLAAEIYIADVALEWTDLVRLNALLDQAMACRDKALCVIND